MGGLERPEYCEDIEYEAGNPLNSPEEDQDCQSGIENRSEYYEGEYTSEHTDESYAAETTLSPEEEARLAEASEAKIEADQLLEMEAYFLGRNNGANNGNY